MTVTLKDGQHVTLRMLLRSIPATLGMSRPQLFQQVETNATKDVIIATYQKSDCKYVEERKMALETDLVAQLCPERSTQIFVDVSEGLWYTTVSKTKHGQIVTAPQTSKSNIEYIQYTNSIWSSPPKKRTYTERVTSSQQHSARSVTNAAASQQNANHHRGVEVSQPPQYHQTTAPPQTQPADTTLTDEIHQRFLAVENDMKEQKKWNQVQKE